MKVNTLKTIVALDFLKWLDNHGYFICYYKKDCCEQNLKLHIVDSTILNYLTNQFVNSRKDNE